MKFNVFIVFSDFTRFTASTRTIFNSLAFFTFPHRRAVRNAHFNHDKNSKLQNRIACENILKL